MGPGRVSGAAVGPCLQSCASLQGGVVMVTSVSAEEWLRAETALLCVQLWRVWAGKVHLT